MFDFIKKFFRKKKKKKEIMQNIPPKKTGKRCKRCNRVKNRNKFYNSHTKDGRESTCISCRLERCKINRNYKIKKNILKNDLKKNSFSNTKKCTKCAEIKPKSEFQIRRDTKDGLKYHCKSCVLEYRIKYNHFKKKQKEHAKQTKNRTNISHGNFSFLPKMQGESPFSENLQN